MVNVKMRKKEKDKYSNGEINRERKREEKKKELRIVHSEALRKHNRSRVLNPPTQRTAASRRPALLR